MSVDTKGYKGAEDDSKDKDKAEHDGQGMGDPKHDNNNDDEDETHDRIQGINDHGRNEKVRLLATHSVYQAAGCHYPSKGHYQVRIASVTQELLNASNLFFVNVYTHDL